MPFGDSYNIGEISIQTNLDLSNYQRDKQKLIADATKLADDIGNRFSGAIGNSFSGAGKGLADSLTRDFPRQGLQIQNSLGGTITGAILRANFATAIAGQIVGGVTRAGSLITRPLQDIVSTITGAIGQGLDFGNAARIRTEVLSTASALSGVAKVSFEEAEGAIESLNESLAASAAALPGSTNAFLEVARQVSDEIARVAVDAEGIFDPQRWEQMTSRLATSATVLGESSGVNAGLTAMGLSRALSGSASLAELRNLNLFQNNPTLLSEIERQLSSIGAESLRDVTAEGRVNILQAAFDTVVTPELIEQASNSAEGLIEAFRSRLGDPTTGLFSISRDLAATGESVFDTLTETLRLTIGEGTGLLDRFASAAESAGLRIGDPMEAVQAVVLRVNSAIARLAENTEAFFQSDFGQRLVSILNGVQSAIANITTSLSGFSLDLSLPGLSGLSRPIDAISNALSLARDYALGFLDAFRGSVDLGGFFEAGRTALEGLSQLVDRSSSAVSNFVSSNRDNLVGIAETLGSVFGSAISAVGDLTSAVSRRFMPVLQRAANLTVGVFDQIWEGIRPLREFFASDRTRVLLSDAADGLGRIGEILVGAIGIGLQAALSLLDKILVQSGLIEGILKSIGILVQLAATGIGGVLQLVSRWGELTDAVSGGYEAIYNIVHLRIREAINTVIRLVSDRFSPAVEFVQDLFSGIVQTVQDIWDWLDRTFSISERLAGPFETIKAISEEIVGYISAMFGGLQRVLGLGGRGQQGAQQFGPGVQAGQGALVGIGGNTGRSTGPHLDIRYSTAYAQRAGLITGGVRDRISEDVLNRFEIAGVPLSEAQITSEHATRNRRRPTHAGIDYAVEIGDEITTTVPIEKVEGPFWDQGGGGWYTSVTFADGVEVNLLHLDPSVQGSQLGAARGGGGSGPRLAAGLTQASANLGQNADPVYSGLLQRFGGDRTIASAFYGNFVQESGLDTGAVNQIGASGLAQWLGSRKEELMAFADRMGTEWTDLNTQLDFVLQELETSESAAWQKIREVATTGDVAATTTAVRRYYERPGENEARDDRRIAAAEQAFAQGPSVAPVTAPTDLSQFLDPTQRFQRELEEGRRLLGREAQLRAQARQEADRSRQLEREQREDTLRARQAELSPTDTAGATLIDAQIRALQVADQISDRILQNERQINDLYDARETQRLQRQNLEGQRAAFEQAQATGASASTTEQELRKLEAEISPVNFDEAIASLERYGQELDALREDKLRPIQASLSRFATQAVEDSRQVLRSIEQLNRQYSDPSAFEQHQAAVDGIALAYEENGKRLDQTISSLDQLTSVENLTEDQYDSLAQQLEEATRAREGLNAAEERAIELANEAYESQQRLATINLVEQLMSPQLRAAEAEAQSIERFDRFGANIIRRQAAIATMGTRFAEEIENANIQTAALIRQFEQAQAEDDQDSLDRFQSLGIGGVEDIQSIAEQNRAAIEQVYSAELRGVAEQFPTVAESFRSSLRDATSQGLTEGFRGLATGEMGIGDFFKNIADNLFNSVVTTGSQRLSDWITGGLFGNGEGGGLLDGLFGANAPSIPGQQEGGGLGSAIAEGFAAKMPEAGNMLAGGRGQGFIGKLIQGVGGLFGGGGSSGGGLFGTIGGLLGGLFSDGGPVRNYSGGGIAAAMRRERSQSGREPVLGVLNRGEFVFSAPAVNRIGVGVLDSLNNGGFIPNYAIGGSIEAASHSAIPIHGNYEVPQARPETRRFKLETVRIGNMDVVSADQVAELEGRLNGLEGSLDSRAAAAAVEAFRSSPAARSRAGF